MRSIVVGSSNKPNVIMIMREEATLVIASKRRPTEIRVIHEVSARNAQIGTYTCIFKLTFCRGLC